MNRQDWNRVSKNFARCANIINTQWAYSWHWSKEPDQRHWTMDAKHDCQNEIMHIEQRLAALKKLKAELEGVAKEFLP
jgi:hypothetical protein